MTRDDSGAGGPVTTAQRSVWGLQMSIVLLAVWMALNGVQYLWLGLGTAAAGGAVAATLVPARPYPWKVHRLLAFFAYFVARSLQGGIDVAFRALHPRLPLQPVFEDYRMDLPPGQPRTLLVSVISLLPGTLSADLEGDDLLVVHSLIGPAAGEIADLERWVGWLFSVPEGSIRK